MSWILPRPILLSITAMLALGGCEAANGRAAPFRHLDPFCRPGFPVRETMTISFQGEVLTDAVEYLEDARSRDWIYMMNTAGCEKAYGGLFAFVTRDKELIILSRTGASDRAGYILDSAIEPRTWRRFYLNDPDSPVRIVSEAFAGDGTGSRDSLDRIGRALLESDFRSGGLRSTSGPGEALNHRRWIRPARFYPVENPVVPEPDISGEPSSPATAP